MHICADQAVTVQVLAAGGRSPLRRPHATPGLDRVSPAAARTAPERAAAWAPPSAAASRVWGELGNPTPRAGPRGAAGPGGRVRRPQQPRGRRGPCAARGGPRRRAPSLRGAPGRALTRAQGQQHARWEAAHYRHVFRAVKRGCMQAYLLTYMWSTPREASVLQCSPARSHSPADTRHVAILRLAGGHCHAWQRFNKGHLSGGASSPAAPPWAGGCRAACRRARARATSVTCAEDLPALRAPAGLPAPYCVSRGSPAHRSGGGSAPPAAVHAPLWPSDRCSPPYPCSVSGRTASRSLSAHTCCDARGAT